MSKVLQIERRENERKQESKTQKSRGAYSVAWNSYRLNNISCSCGISRLRSWPQALVTYTVTLTRKSGISANYGHFSCNFVGRKQSRVLASANSPPVVPTAVTHWLLRFDFTAHSKKVHLSCIAHRCCEMQCFVVKFRSKAFVVSSKWIGKNLALGFS